MKILLAVGNFFVVYKDLLITVTWVLAAISWVVTNKQANRRELRKETRSEIDAISKAAAEVISKCRKYYSLPPSDPEDDVRSAEISFEVKRVLIRTERLSRRVGKNSAFVKAKTACGDFFDAVTQDPFQSKNRGVLAPGSTELRLVEAGVHRLIDALEEGFTVAFK